VDKGHLDVVRTLVAKGASVNSPRGQETALHIAAKKNHAEIINLLLEYGANFETIFNHKKPLDIAIWDSFPATAEQLLSKGARPGSHYSVYGSPLHLVARFDEDGSHSPLLTQAAVEVWI
jgi:ankyrin repeat protein